MLFSSQIYVDLKDSDSWIHH